jgi:hypothetical protein
MQPRRATAAVLAALALGSCAQEGPDARGGGGERTRGVSAELSGEAFDPSVLLAGTTALDDPSASRALAELARDRGLLGARWLAGTVAGDDRFAYWYQPGSDTYHRDDYNAVRHAGVTYSLFQALDWDDDPAIRRAGETGVRWIASHAIETDAGRAFEHDGITKLGGQALAVVALLERRRVTGDASRDPLIDDLATFLLSMERPTPSGAYWNSFVDGERLPEPDSDYYPGEALLALARLAAAFPARSDYAEAAQRAAHYLVHVRDGDLPALGVVPRDDHWLTIALNDLDRLDPDDGYAAVVRLQGERMRAGQYTAADGRADLVGASGAQDPVNYTSTATKGEAFVAAWSLAERRRDPVLADAMADAARATAQFAMRVQFGERAASRFPAPAHAVGAWPTGPDSDDVRMDFVQHNASLLFGVAWMTLEGDVPAQPDV